MGDFETVQEITRGLKEAMEAHDILEASTAYAYADPEDILKAYKIIERRVTSLFKRLP